MIKILKERLGRLTIKLKILLLISLFGLIMISFYTIYIYKINSANIIKSTDDKLLSGVYATNLICGSSFHETITGPSSLSEAEHMKNIKKLNVLAEQLGLKYLYTMVEDNGKVYYASSSATEEELQNNGYSPFYQECKEASENIFTAFRTKEPFFEEYTTRWGSFRSMYLPMQASNGRVYLIGADVPLADIQSKLISSLWTSIIAGVSIYCIFLVITFFVLSTIIKPIRKLADHAKKISEGNYKVSISLNTHDETRLLADTINTMVTNINTSLDNLAYEKASVEKKVEEAVRQSEEQKSYLAHSVESMLDAMGKFSQGDLTVCLKSTQDDLIGNLFKGFNTTVENFKLMVLNVRTAVAETASAGEQISSSAEEMAAGSLEQAHQATEIAGSIDEMTRTILQNTKNASMASSTALEAGEKARQGGKAVIDTIEEMDKIADVVTKSASKVTELGKNSNQIGEIIQVIDDIADQTNLLALNAAIEAARAGEQGRGFAVVADEVRKLAEKTTRATKEIAAMIKQIQADTQIAIESIEKGTKEVETGKTLARRAGQALEEIIGGTEKVSQIINEVAHTSEKQASSSEEISKNIETITSVAHLSSSGIQQIAKASGDLGKLTMNLKKLIDKFHISSQKEKVSWLN